MMRLGMKIRMPWCQRVLVGVLALGLHLPPAAADDAAHNGGVTVQVIPYQRPGSEGPSSNLYVVELRATGAGAGAEVVADRRLLRLRARIPGYGVVTCQHPQRPHRSMEARRIHLASGERWREWFDIRMYCWNLGSRLAAHIDNVEFGQVSFSVEYGFSSGSRTRWVVDPNLNHAPGIPASRIHRLVGPTLLAEPWHRRSGASSVTPIQIGLYRTDARDDDVLGFHVWVGATRERNQQIYIRNDMWSFRVTGPSGQETCTIPEYFPGPLPDFYHSVGYHRVLSMALDGDGFCRDSFHLAGVYTVTPILNLRYDGHQHQHPSVIGTYEGRPVPIRIRHGRYPNLYFPHMLPEADLH